MPVSGDRLRPAGAQERGNATMMAGSNTHESGREWDLNDQAGLDAMETTGFKDFTPQFAAFYRPSLYGGSVNAAARAFITDGPAAEVALVQRSRPGRAAPVYTDLWTHGRPGDAGAIHGSELVCVYENMDTVQGLAIAKTVNVYWANFIKTGNPNGTGLPHWPESHSEHTMELGDHLGPGPCSAPVCLKPTRTMPRTRSVCSALSGLGILRS